MDSLMEIGVAVFGVVLFVVAMSVPSMLRSFRRVVAAESLAPFGSIMRHYGVRPDDAAGREYELVFAASRCGSCRMADSCRGWVESGNDAALDRCCPNRPFLRGLEKSR